MCLSALGLEKPSFFLKHSLKIFFLTFHCCKVRDDMCHGGPGAAFFSKRAEIDGSPVLYEARQLEKSSSFCFNGFANLLCFGCLDMGYCRPRTL